MSISQPLRTILVAVAFFAIGAFLLLSEHRVHALGYLPYLLLLACPILHLFMHGGHRGHGGHAGHSRNGAGRAGQDHQPPSHAED